jgi:hypothetical protein
MGQAFVTGGLFPPAPFFAARGVYLAFLLEHGGGGQMLAGGKGAAFDETRKGGDAVFIQPGHF